MSQQDVLPSPKHKTRNKQGSYYSRGLVNKANFTAQKMKFSV